MEEVMCRVLFWLAITTCGFLVRKNSSYSMITLLKKP